MAVPTSSLERNLSRALVIATLGVGVVAAAGSFVIGYLEARGLQDEMLRQVASLSATGSGNAGDADSEILSLRLPPGPRPAWLPESLSPGFHTLASHAESMRVFVRSVPGGGRIITAQPTEVREDVATSSALHTLIPVLLLLPLLAWLAMRVVGAERRALERQRQFIADAAHELRSPLTALSLQAENVANAASLDAARGRIAALRSGLDRTGRLTEQLLRLAKPVRPSTPPSLIDLRALAEESATRSVPRAEGKGISLRLDLRASPRVPGEPEDLWLILDNALDNALRYTGSGGAVILRLREERGDAILEVEDTGPGIPAEHRAAVFEPFHRLGSSPEGSGLGLSIARDAASRLGGSIVLADREAGEGLIFRYLQRTA